MAGDLIYAFRVMRLPLLDAGGAAIGQIDDIVVVPAGGHGAPRVVGFVAASQRRRIFVNAARIGDLGSEGAQLRSWDVDLNPFKAKPGEILLGRDVIDHRVGEETVSDVAHTLRDPHGTFGDALPVAFGWQNSAAQGASASAKCTPSLDKSKTPAVLAYAFGSHASSNGDATNESHDAGGPVGFGLNEEITPALRAGRTQAVCLTGEITHALTHEGHDASEDAINSVRAQLG